jgi:hypothetical protein
MDLHGGAVTAAKLAAGDRVHKLDLVATGVGSHTATVVIDELTITIDCSAVSGSVAIMPTFRSSVVAEENWSYIQNADGGTMSTLSGGAPMAANEDETPLGSPVSISGHSMRDDGQIVYSNASRVITVTFHVFVNQNANHLCEMTGTATPASLK